MTCYPLWTRIGAGKSGEILDCVQKTHKKMYRTAVDVLAPRMKMRAVKVLEMPRAERHRLWAGILAHPQMDPLSLTLFSQWLSATQAEMMARWLDALGIPHDGKGILQNYHSCPDKETLRSAMEALLAAHDPAGVLVYLTVFNAAPEARWVSLAELIAVEARFPLAPPPTA